MHSSSAGQISVKHVYEIAKIKATPDISIEKMASRIVGSAKGMGIQVVY